MNIFSALWQRIREALQKMIGAKSIEKVLHVTPAISNRMIDAIDMWSLLYTNQAPWLHEPTAHDPTRVVSLGLPAMIASEKARTATIEMKSEITVPMEEETIPNPDYKEPVKDELGNVQVSAVPETIIQQTPVSGAERAEFMNEQYQKGLLSKICTQLEYGIAKGGLVIKPYPVIDDEEADVKGHFAFDFIQADGFYPLSFNSSGELTECAFIQRKVDKETVYTRLEHHKLEKDKVIVSNTAYRTKNTSTTDNNAMSPDLGDEISLTSVPEWADLEPKTEIANVDRLLFGYFKMPEANTIDPHSPLGVSGFSRAVDLIKDADNQYSRLLWEYEAGEMALDIDIDALESKKLQDGTMHTSMLQKQRRLFRKLDLGTEDTYQPFAPALRDSSFIGGLNTILMRIEDTCSLSRGTLSDPAAEARTATELKILKQRTFVANAHIQEALEKALRDVVYCMDVYCTLYNMVNDVKMINGEVDPTSIGQYTISFEWDDSIISDVDEELNKRLALMDKGLESKINVRMWYFGETEVQAREALERIKEEARERMEQELQFAPINGGGI